MQKFEIPDYQSNITQIKESVVAPPIPKLQLFIIIFYLFKLNLYNYSLRGNRDDLNSGVPLYIRTARKYPDF